MVTLPSELGSNTERHMGSDTRSTATAAGKGPGAACFSLPERCPTEPGRGVRCKVVRPAALLDLSRRQERAMTRFRWRLLIGASLLVLVLLGFGGWFYFVAFANLEAALYRAEAFAFRRMMVTQLGMARGRPL